MENKLMQYRVFHEGTAKGEHLVLLACYERKVTVLNLSSVDLGISRERSRESVGYSYKS